MTAKKFKNFTDTEFSWKFDGIEHTFPAGMEIFLEDFKADHFAKHLVDREMNRLGLRTNDVKKREEITAKCFPTDEIVTPLEALNLNEKADVHAEKEKEVEFPDLKKRGRPKKHEK
mgnify:CR=1 FL=1